MIEFFKQQAIKHQAKGAKMSYPEYDKAMLSGYFAVPFILALLVIMIVTENREPAIKYYLMTAWAIPLFIYLEFYYINLVLGYKRKTQTKIQKAARDPKVGKAFPHSRKATVLIMLGVTIYELFSDNKRAFVL